MSTERLSPERRERRRRSAYARRAGITIGTLATLVAGLAIAGSFQGPKLLRADVPADALVGRTDQSIVLTADQTLDAVSPESVSIEPAVPFAVSTDGSRVTLTLPDMLDFASSYRVRVGVSGAYTGRDGVLSTEVATPDAVLYTLVRSGDPYPVQGAQVTGSGATTAGSSSAGAVGGATPSPASSAAAGPSGSASGHDDLIVRSRASASTEETVFSAPRIQEFVALPGGVLVATPRETPGTDLTYASFDPSVAPLAVALPPGATARELRASDATTLAGFIVDGTAADGSRISSRLHVFDASDTAAGAREVTGPGGAPMTVVDWRFVPGTGSMVVQADDEQVYLVDPRGGKDPLPLGKHSEMRGFLPGTTSLVLSDVDDVHLVDLASGTDTILRLPLASYDPSLHAGELLVQTPDSYLQVVQSIVYTGGRNVASARLLAVTPEGTRELYRPDADGTRVSALCLSPNGRLAAVELAPDGSKPDLYPLVPGFTGAHVALVDTRTGEVKRYLPGFRSNWCR